MRLLPTAAIATGSVTALAVAFLAGTTLGRAPDSGGPPPTAPTAPTAPIALANADLVPADSCEDLRAWYVDRALDQVTAYGWSSYLEGAVFDIAQSSEAAPSTGSVRAGVPSVDRSTSGDDGTNVQEAGVDEPDVVKTDGRILARVQDDAVLVYDVTGAEPALLSTTALPALDSPELLLSGTRLVALGTDTDRHAAYDGAPPPPSASPGTRLVVLDLTEPAAPAVLHEAAYDAPR